MPATDKNRMNSIPREKVPEPTALVLYATYSRNVTPVITSPHEVTHVTN
jgi:hypothetical protein